MATLHYRRRTQNRVKNAKEFQTQSLPTTISTSKKKYRSSSGNSSAIFACQAIQRMTRQPSFLLLWIQWVRARIHRNYNHCLYLLRQEKAKDFVSRASRDAWRNYEFFDCSSISKGGKCEDKQVFRANCLINKQTESVQLDCLTFLYINNQIEYKVKENLETISHMIKLKRSSEPEYNSQINMSSQNLLS